LVILPKQKTLLQFSYRRHRHRQRGYIRRHHRQQLQDIQQLELANLAIFLPALTVIVDYWSKHLQPLSHLVVYKLQNENHQANEYSC
jgi:hypothetical protein